MPADAMFSEFTDILKHAQLKNDATAADLVSERNVLQSALFSNAVCLISISLT